MSLFHVEQFDRKYVRRTIQFIPRQNERGMMFLVTPPLNDGRNGRQRGKRGFCQDAKQVHVREVRMELSCSSGAIKNDAAQIIPRCRSHLADELINLFLRNHRNASFLPAPAGAPTTGTAAAKASEPAAKTTPAKTTT